MNEKEREKIIEFDKRLLNIRLLMSVLADAIRANDNNTHFETFIEIITDKMDVLYDDLCFFSIPPERLSEQDKPTRTD